MISRTVKSPVFTIVVGDKRIVVKHIYCKGKRCRVTVPPGVIIEDHRERDDLPPNDPKGTDCDR